MTGRRVVRLALAAVCGLVGLIWFGQGIGLIGGSFMTGDAVWAVIGVVMLAFAVVLVRGARPPAE